MNKIEICLTPELIHQFTLEGKVVVVVDIFRATSCMVTGLAHGIEAIYPVGSVAECFALGEKGMITAGERGGQKIEGFVIGNSPFEYMKEELQGQSVAVTTTNGTKALLASLEADEILIGAFLNISALTSYLSDLHKDVVIHCAGWKGTVNLEDTLFAGALVDELKSSHQTDGDPAILAHHLYKANQNNLLSIAKSSSHARRLESFGIEQDITFCMDHSLYSVVPAYKDGKLQLLN